MRARAAPRSARAGHAPAGAAGRRPPVGERLALVVEQLEVGDEAERVGHRDDAGLDRDPVPGHARRLVLARLAPQRLAGARLLFVAESQHARAQVRADASAARGWPATIGGAMHKRSRRGSWLLSSRWRHSLSCRCASVARPRGFAICQSCQGDGEQIHAGTTRCSEGAEPHAATAVSRPFSRAATATSSRTRSSASRSDSASRPCRRRSSSITCSARPSSSPSTTRRARTASSFQNRENWRRDPVMQHCKRHSMPIIWDQGTYAAQGLGDMWEEQARFGYRHRHRDGAAPARGPALLPRRRSRPAAAGGPRTS